MKKTVFIKNKTMIFHPLFLSGITRAGKFFFGKFLSGFDKIEYFQYVSILEHLPFMVRSGVVTKDAAVSLLQVNVDEHAYNYWIGRNLNLRFDDASNVANSGQVGMYIDRSRRPVSKRAAAQIRDSGRYPVFILHESLPHIQIYFSAFPGLRWINLTRHPIDLIYSWHKRSWGKRQISDPLSFCPVMRKAGCVFPWYASGWEREYAAMPGIDRIIRIMLELSRMEKSAYRSLDGVQKKQVLFVRYEDLVEKTELELKRVGRFLRVRPRPELTWILKREKCPRCLLPEERLKKAKAIRKIAGKKLFDLMIKLSFEYENGVSP